MFQFEITFTALKQSIHIYYPIIFFCLSCFTVKASDSITIKLLVQRIAAMQAISDGNIPKGSFASYRTYHLNKHRQKADINAFYTGLICFTLRDLENQFDAIEKQQVDNIINQAKPYFNKFKNQKGRNTYNFWTTDTSRIFPNSGLLNTFNKSQALPDDFDDTVILLMAMNAPDSVAKAIHRLMQDYTNQSKKKINNTFKQYQDIPAYSTWFGKKMPIDFDVSVLMNVLYFVQKYQLPFSKADSASVDLIVKVIESNQYETTASYVSPHYNTTAVILYHLSRLMALKPIPALEQYKSQLILSAKNCYTHSNSFLEKIILSTTLMRWGIDMPTMVITAQSNLIELIEEDDYPFFIANIASMLTNPFKKIASSTGLVKFTYHSPAYNQRLLLENLVWQQKRQTK